MTTYRKKLIEVSLPLDVISRESAKEKSVPRRDHPQGIHLWWARRPLAACRAVLFGQLVDDPSSWPNLFPTDEDKDRERQRLFGLIEELVKWENSNNENVINAAKLEIARSIARGRMADGGGNECDAAVLADKPKIEGINKYLVEIVPPVHDPFAGGGSIPLEALRLGLRAYASDLNPVAVLINKALIEFPPRFANLPPVNPEARKDKQLFEKKWKGAQGLAEDVRYYGKWMRDEAEKRIGHLYPRVKITKEMATGRPELKAEIGHELTVIAWLWARTVESPDPAFKGVHVPLVSSFWLSKKKNKEIWVEPVVNKHAKTYRFEIRTGKPTNLKAIDEGTKLGRGANFRCVMSENPIEPAYVKAEGIARRIGSRMMGLVAESNRQRFYVPPTNETEEVAVKAKPTWAPEQGLPKNPRWFSPPDYGMPTYADLFTPRQLVALTTFCDLVEEARQLILKLTRNTEYSNAVALYLGLCLGKLADYNSSISTWNVIGGSIRSTFSRQAIPMTWDYYETTPLQEKTGSWSSCLKWVSDVVENINLNLPAVVLQQDAMKHRTDEPAIFSTDPPYYDNIGYADLSDFFYVWLRRSLKEVFPDLLTTMLVPKNDELVATPYRHGGKEQAEKFFLDGMTRALTALAENSVPDVPAAIYYAFKQAESGEGGISSTGWETFLDAVVRSGFVITGTWPLNTERNARSIGIGTNALASSVVLACRKRTEVPSPITRAEFRRMLRDQLPMAMKTLQESNIAPVDVAQAAIGPGMAIFSRHAKVIEADGSDMTVRTALQLINEALDEYLTALEGESDPDTRFAITWFEQHQYTVGPFGEAETLAKARNVSVSGIVEAGIIESRAGKVRVLKRAELPGDWDPDKDKRLTVWEATQHLIKRMDEQGEQAAADLLAALGGDTAQKARDLAYRLYTTCERKGWAEEARAYNGLVVAWPELTKLAGKKADEEPAQKSLF